MWFAKLLAANHLQLCERMWKHFWLEVHRCETLAYPSNGGTEVGSKLSSHVKEVDGLVSGDGGTDDLAT